MKLLVTGANGFVGRALCSEAVSRALWVKSATRITCTLPHVSEGVTVGAIDECTDWRFALNGIEAVVHLAARAHILQDFTSDPLSEFRRVNVQGTMNLARQAAHAGVKRLIFISSIGVNGAETDKIGFSAEDVPAPHSAYAVSKYEAELGLKDLAVKTGMDVVIIRPPLVYGPNAPGNFGLLMRCLRLGLPLPLGAIHNRRSLVSLGNLVDLIMICLTHPAAANQTFVVSDGEDFSTTELLRRMGQAMGYPARLVPVSPSFLMVAAGILGKADMAQRLCGSLQVDISKTCAQLGWTPPLTLNEGLRQAAVGFRQ